MKLVFSLVWLVAAAPPPNAADSIIPEDVKASARARVEAGRTVGIAIGAIDGHRRECFFAGRPAHDGEAPLDEHTVFEIGSITKVFTALLLADAVERGEVRLDEPVQQLLPSTVRVPKRGDKEITLFELARHRSGLPRVPANAIPWPADPYASYTADKLYAFLNDYQLPRDVGERYEYSNLGAGLLGHVLARRAATSYEDLLVERICKPLKLNDTRITLTPGMTDRLARGYPEGSATPTPGWHFDCLAGCGAVRSTVADMLRFLAVNMGLEDSPLAAAIARTHQGRYPCGPPGMSVALGWHVFDRHGVEILWHNGGTGGYHGFCGFDSKRRRGVVVLANSTHNIDDLGLHVLAEGYTLASIP